MIFNNVVPALENIPRQLATLTGHLDSKFYKDLEKSLKDILYALENPPRATLSGSTEATLRTYFQSIQTHLAHGIQDITSGLNNAATNRQVLELSDSLQLQLTQLQSSISTIQYSPLRTRHFDPPPPFWRSTSFAQSSSTSQPFLSPTPLSAIPLESEAEPADSKPEDVPEDPTAKE